LASPAPALERGLDLLEAVAEAPPDGVGFTELAGRLGIPPASAARLLNILTRRQFLAKQPQTGGYQPGPALGRLVRQATQEARLRWHADRLLHALRDAAANTAVLFLRDGDKTRCALKHMHEQSRVMQEVGSVRSDLLNYPWGWIFAMALPRARVKQLSEPWTMTEVTREEYRRGLAFYRRHGFTFDHNRRNGWLRFAAPVCAADGTLLAAVALGLNRWTLPESEIRRLGGLELIYK
jgi:DNA-binding IclR family transcriptional regulator